MEVNISPFSPSPAELQDLAPFMELCTSDGDIIKLDCDTSLHAFIESVKNIFDFVDEFPKEREIIFITHGFQASSKLLQLQEIKNSILRLHDKHRLVVMIDWGIASGNQWTPPIPGNWSFKLNPVSYFTVVPTVKRISRWMSPYMAELKHEFGNTISIYGIGHSLGSHLLGVCAKYCEKYHGVNVFDRITGLDPAAPAIVRKRWNLQKMFNLNVPSLCPSDAKFVDVIHTSGGLGTHKPLGHVDFYPNWGRTQPGCFRLSNSSHMRVLDLFSWSIMNPKAFQTNLTFDSLELRNAGGKEPNICKINQISEMGFHCQSRSRGIFYLKTNSNSPWATS